MDEYRFISMDDGADPVAWLALLVSILAIAWTVWNELTSYRRRQADEYWYRGIFSPNCVEPLVSFLNHHIAALQEIDVSRATAEDTRRVCEEFSKKKEELLARLWVSRLFSADYYDIACEQLDGIEDAMATKFARWVVKPAAASGRDLESLRDDAVGKTAVIFAAAARIDLNKFARDQKKTLRNRR